MRHPQYRLARRIPAPPDAVLAAIRNAIAGTRRRDIPPHLQKGVSGVRGKVRGPRFTVGLEQAGESGDATDLVGMVVAADDGGSDVRASVMDSRGAPVHALVLLAVAAILVLTGSSGVAWMLAGFAALVATVATIRNAKGLINDDEAAFLLAWLNGVLDPLATLDAGATPDGADRVSSPS